MNLTLIIAVAIGIVILRFAAGFLFKLLGFGLIIAGIGLYCYQKGYWPFEKNLTSISVLEEKYCKDEGNQLNKCNCIVRKLKTDVNNRFSKEELSALETNRIKLAYLIKRSLDFCEPEIKKCLESKGAIKEYEEFKIELMNMDHPAFKKAGEWIENKQSEINETIDNVLNDKSDIDKKFED